MDYLGSSRIETKQKLGQYLIAYKYKGDITETDSTVEIVTTAPGQDWEIRSSFYFGATDSCQWVTHSRCDRYKDIWIPRMLANKGAGWKQVDANTYVTRYKLGERMELLRQDSCTGYRVRKLNLTRSEYKALVRKS